MYTQINKLHTQVYTKSMYSTKQIETRLDTFEQSKIHNILNKLKISTEKDKNEQ